MIFLVLSFGHQKSSDQIKFTFFKWTEQVQILNNNFLKKNTLMCLFAPNEVKKIILFSKSGQAMFIPLIGDFKNILIINQQMSSSQSMEALSDPLPRLYSCFCDKIFTTYPGIYLHLKSKHSNLFQKYKKLKITKLFKKVKGDNNSDVFKLDKLSQKEITNNNFSSKKIKQNNKKHGADDDEKMVLLEQESQEETKKKRSGYAANAHLHKQPQDSGFYSKSLPTFPREYIEKMSHNPYYPPMANPFFSFPYYSHPQSYPSFNAPTPEPSIKRTMEQYLEASVFSSYEGKVALRNTLYQLMIFLDENYSSAKDPRVRDGVLLSYCDIFSPKFIGPLLNDYIMQKNEEGNESQTALWEANSLKQFTNYLKHRYLLRMQHEPKPNFEQRPEHEHKYEPEPNPNGQSPSELTQNAPSYKPQSEL